MRAFVVRVFAVAKLEALSAHTNIVPNARSILPPYPMAIAVFCLFSSPVTEFRQFFRKPAIHQRNSPTPVGCAIGIGYRLVYGNSSK